MPSTMSCARGVRGTACPTTFPVDRRSTATFTGGLVEGLWVRRRAGREASPCAAILDSQSVKTTEVAGPRGYDAGQKVKGRKRHIAVDTLGLLLAVVVHTADIQDRDGTRWVLARLADRFPRLRVIGVDDGY